jgi:CO dehydrogenase/acetyl-CoA synthase delta subunit
MSVKEERTILEKLINNSENIIGQTPNTQGDMPELNNKPIFTMDMEIIKKNCDKKARKMIKNATGLLLTNEMIAVNPYLRDKFNIDVISLSGMIYQLEINEEMQKVLIEEVRSGAAHPRMFEVFGNLSKIIGELNKQLLQTVEAIKLTYKDIKIDIEDKHQELKAIGPGENGITKNKEGVITMGTKELIKEAKKLKFEKFIKDTTNSIDDVVEI